MDYRHPHRGLKCVFSTSRMLSDFYTSEELPTIPWVGNPTLYTYALIDMRVGPICVRGARYRIRTGPICLEGRDASR